MDLTVRKGSLGYFLWMLVALLLCLYGSNGDETKFTIFRTERDIFTNLRCDDNSCGPLQCDDYGAECFSDENCAYCRCLASMNTFMISEDESEGKCVSDEYIVPESVPIFRFLLENFGHKKCLKAEGGANSFITATDCTTPTLDMLWVWTETAPGTTRLVNVKTLKCMQIPSRINRRITMHMCRKNWSRQQNMKCIIETFASQSLIKIARRLGPFLHLTDSNNVIAWFSNQLWNNNKTLCSTDTFYKGCYRFSDDSFMAYLNYSNNNLKFRISAPIFEENDGYCEVGRTFEFTEDGLKWDEWELDSWLFSIDRINSSTRELKINRMVHLEAWNGTLVKLYVNCGGEKHCVLFKLQSLPEYSEALTTPSKSNGTNSVAIAVPVTLFLVVLILVLGFLVYYRRRKRTQVQRNNNDENGTANPSKGIYEDPDRIHETLKQDEVPHNQEGTTFNTYSYPDGNGIVNQGSKEEEHTYAKTDVDTTHGEASAPPISDDVYHTLEQPPSSDFYNYPDNNNIPNPALTEQKYTYAKDTSMSKANVNKKATPNGGATPPSINDGLYHTLEQEEPASTEQEYSYAKNTDIPSNTKQITQGLSATPSNSDMYHTLEEPSKTQAAVYSTLEEPEDVDNSQVVYETLKTNDPVYNVLEDTNTAHKTAEILETQPKHRM